MTLCGMVTAKTYPILINFRRTDESVAAVFRSWDEAIEDAGRVAYAQTLVISADAKTGFPNFAFVDLAADAKQSTAQSAVFKANKEERHGSRS